MEEFESNFEPWNREWKSSNQVRSMESGMEEFEPSSDSCNLEWKSSRQVQILELGMEKFEGSSRLGIRNGEVRAKFQHLESEIEQ